MFHCAVKTSIEVAPQSGYRLVLITKHPTGDDKRELEKDCVLFPQRDNEFVIKLEKI